MTAPVFVDTNVLVYRHDSTDPVRQARAEAWYELVWRLRLGRISFQVLQELYATLTRKLVPRFDVQEARVLVRDLTAWQPFAADLAPARARLATGGTLLAVLLGRLDRRRRAGRRLPGLAHGGPPAWAEVRGGAGDRPVRVTGAAAGGDARRVGGGIVRDAAAPIAGPRRSWKSRTGSSWACRGRTRWNRPSPGHRDGHVPRISGQPTPPCPRPPGSARPRGGPSGPG